MKHHISLRSYWAFLRSQGIVSSLLVSLAFLVAGSFLAVLPFVIGQLTGDVTAAHINKTHVLILMWILVGLSISHMISWRGSEILYLRYMKPLAFRYEQVLFSNVISEPYPYFVDKLTGKIASYITLIRQELDMLTQEVPYNYVGQIVSILSILVIFISVNWETSLVYVCGLAVLFLVGRKFQGPASKAESIASDTKSTRNGILFDVIANFQNVKSFHSEQAEIAALHNEQENVLNAVRTSFWASYKYWGNSSFIVRGVIWPISIILNVYFYLNHTINITQLATLLSAILIFTTTIWESIWQLSQFKLQIARTDEAHRYLFGEKIVVSAPQPEEVPEVPFEETLELRDISFHYPEHSPLILDEINLVIHRGEKVGIVGRSGAGKSTLTKLLLGYYQVSQGEFILDGKTVSSQALSHLIAFVPQDTSMFHRSIAENIAYAARIPPFIDGEVNPRVSEAAAMAHADEFIDSIPERYHALVGERGVKLSIGQRARVAIARAFLQAEPILILDEATAALDTESELLVQHALERLWEVEGTRGQTVLAIAHRLSTLQNMDRIIVLDRGKIVEDGTPKELLSGGGLYAQLWEHQVSGFITE
ncbi:MAG: ABC transporter ATP-binding protein [Candidatus Dormibacteria bacterium]